MVDRDHSCWEVWSQAIFAYLLTLIPLFLDSKQKKTYQCIKCQMTFENEREIQIHVANHMIGKRAPPRSPAGPLIRVWNLWLQSSLLAFRAKDRVTAAVSETFQTGVKMSEREHFSLSKPSCCGSTHITIKLLTISSISQHKFPSISETKCFPVVKHSGAIMLQFCMS